MPVLRNQTLTRTLYVAADDTADPDRSRAESLTVLHAVTAIARHGLTIRVPATSYDTTMVTSVIPQWTAELRRPASGLDHLGLGSVSSAQILTRLVPGINVQSTHPRYHAFYAFLLDEFWRRDGLPRDRSAWREFFRPRAFAFSVASNLCDHPGFDGTFGGVVGSVRTGPLARRPPEDGYDVQYDYIKEPLGGYGLYYRTLMATLGLIYPSPESGYPIDVPTEQGQRVAAAFREAISGTTYWSEFFDSPTITTDVVEEYGEAACLCRLRIEQNPDRELMRQVMLYGGAQTHASARRASLRMLIDIAHEVDGPISQNDFRQLIYFRGTTDGRRWTPSDLPTSDEQWTVPDTSRRWRMYQAREFHAYAINSIWSWLVDWGIERGGAGRPPKTNDVITALIKSLDFDRLANALGISGMSISTATTIQDAQRKLRVLGGEPDIAPTSDESWIDRPYDVDAPLTEWSLYETAHSRDSDTRTTAAFALLLLTASRIDPATMAGRPEWAYAQLGGRGRLSIDQFHRDLATRRSRHATVADVAEWLVRFYVIGQHLRVAASKLPSNTYRFVREGDSLRFIDKPRPVEFNNSRFDAMRFTLAGLGLVGPLGLDRHPLDVAGLEFRETGHLQTLAHGG